MGIQRKLNRMNKKDLAKEKDEVIKKHPTAKYISELTDEIEEMHEKYPDIKFKFNEQIQLIRNSYEQKRKKQDARKQEIINAILKKSEEKLKEVEQNYLNDEVWMLMQHVELERNELRDIIKNNYGENNQETETSDK